MIGSAPEIRQPPPARCTHPISGPPPPCRRLTPSSAATAVGRAAPRADGLRKPPCVCVDQLDPWRPGLDGL